MTNRRDFLKKAGMVTAAAGASTLAAPAVHAAGKPIKWRLQT
ncbi:MAG TPA: C4-dicarboxylate ABC transporter, partial [Rhizobiales bacterium]|nr:C4-dicarboxylate ABC transporter [Hyphomicrobiales bacterium]